MNRVKSPFIAVFVLFFLIFAFGINVNADDNEAVTARPSANGRLSVTAANLTDGAGNKVILKGVSLHGITWYPEFIDTDLFIQVSREWNANLVRLPVYPEEYINDREECLSLVRRGIEAANAADMYVIIDWHVLEEHDPNTNIEYAYDFFDTIASEYADEPGMIFEICNEPNGETSWSDIRDYAYKIIPVIRKQCPESVILIGTPDYSKSLISAARNSIKYDNIMYTLHFYAGTHREDLRREYATVRNIGLPIFVSECGLSEASGTGDIDYSSAASWFSLLEENDTGFAIWSLSNKNETSALFTPYYEPSRPFTDNDLTPAGKWVKDLLSGEDPRNIPEPKADNGLSVLSAFMFRILETENVEVARSWPKMALWTVVVITLCVMIFLKVTISQKKKYHVYDDILTGSEKMRSSDLRRKICSIIIMVSVFFTLMYIGWRIIYSIPFGSGPIAITGNIVLLIVEILGFLESLILYHDLMGLKEHDLPAIDDEEYPDVDIFIATYNEPADLLVRTINGCNHLKYPDKNKVHVWLCDDNRRQEMRELASKMGIGYFDRPDNSGAKAGNLNHALGLTSAPYIVTFDADMIPRSDFLLKTIPYFVDANKRSGNLPDNQKIRLGLLQTPQCFYTPDVFQHALYSENNAPNEQDFFYRTIEVAKTSSNSVIYGGSNTILSREALNAVGGFYTGSITEDFATGMLIESAGFVSLALPEPLASGMTPHTYKEHIQQRKRWGRGVISTSKKLHLFRQPGLSMMQKLSYLSSVVYWLSPLKNLVYIISPMFFACFAIPVFKCGWLDLVIYWLPMFILQDVCLRLFSRNSVSLKWSGIYETSVMPHLLIPIIKESFGITTSVFEVTDKSSKKKPRYKADVHTMIPFIVLLVLSVFGILRSVWVFTKIRAFGIAILLFWLIRNAYFLLMSLFLIDGRDDEYDDVTVIDAEPVRIIRQDSDNEVFEGITTRMTVHNMKVFLDDRGSLKIGDTVKTDFTISEVSLTLGCIVTMITESRYGDSCVVGLEIVNASENEMHEYMQILHDRIPTLPQSLTRDYGIVNHLLRNISYRVLR